MNSNYKVIKFRSDNSKEVNDQISIEEPLEIILKYKDKENWIENTISITMRTPGDDEDLVTGFLFNERVIEKISHIENIVASGEPVGKYKLQNNPEYLRTNRLVSISGVRVRALETIDENFPIPIYENELVVLPGTDAYSYETDLVREISNSSAQYCFSANSDVCAEDHPAGYGTEAVSYTHLTLPTTD